MVTPLERTSRVDLILENSNTVMASGESYEVRMARFERIGVRLFSVANCLVSFGHLAARFDRSELAMVMQEANLCDSMGFADEINVISDLSRDEKFSQHPCVQADPHIRFCARHPIFNAEEELVGNIFLIDYVGRDLDDESRLLFADLAHMVERELDVGVMRIEANEMRRQIRSLKRDALLDPVLGMWNRGAIIRSLSLEMDRCAKAEKPLSLLFIGVDQYSALRESFGTVFSDTLLLKVVSRMRSCIRPFDALGRFESDAFMVVLPGASNLVAAAVAERIRLSVVTHQEKLGEQAVEVSICIGIASTSIFTQQDSNTLISLAERALRKAKQSGPKIVQASLEDTEITS